MRLVWDEPGTRFFETGVDHGVLYPNNTDGVPWNGITGITENGSDSVEEYYVDGVKTINAVSTGEFQGSLKSITYPDEFMIHDGFGETFNGFLAEMQTGDYFGLSYRTLVGNDIEGLGHGYRIHILYNLLAIPDTVSRTSKSNSPTLTEFGWNLYGIPHHVLGYGPVGYVYIDSRLADLEYLMTIENILYGTESDESRLIMPWEFVDGFNNPGPIIST